MAGGKKLKFEYIQGVLVGGIGGPEYDLTDLLLHLLQMASFYQREEKRPGRGDV